MKSIVAKYEKEIMKTFQEYFKHPYDYNNDCYKDEICCLYQVNEKEICVNLEDVFNTQKVFRITIWDASTEINWKLLVIWDCVL